eukprot:TRINITY_DN75865_c0_g1_i1.p1 TRINITY_DN75865_c0_g1~~TRINITY_DN75865_c0_g1_i1.p1  ORF type:complete len:221 (-),score=55.06 TRINITY_DN75865_c0_g1_i1:57-719(-)
MYSLRRINNNYEGGTRSDYVVVGHPEYNLGKVRLGQPEGPYILSKFAPPEKKVLDEKLNPKEEAIVNRLRTVAPRPGHKERAQNAQHGVSVKGQLDALSGDLRIDFDKFLAKLRSEALPMCVSDRVTAGAGNHLGSSGTSRFYEGFREELADLAARLRSDPENTERDLLISGSWKYYASRLERARRQELVLKREQKKQKKESGGLARSSSLPAIASARRS